jgi:hypothetical protein
MIQGYYYLHTNGDLIFKRDSDSIVADLRDSDFVRAFWPLDTMDRASAWAIVTEAGALGADPKRINELATLWKCDDADATHYADWLKIRLYLDGYAWCATFGGFTNLQESDAGFGPTCLSAITELCRSSEYRASKMWGASFKQICERNA